MRVFAEVLVSAHAPVNKDALSTQHRGHRGRFPREVHTGNLELRGHGSRAAAG